VLRALSLCTCCRHYPGAATGVLFAHPSQPYQPSPKGSRVGLRIVLFEACSAFTRVAACTLALSPIRDTLIEGFSHFVTSMTAPVASGWSGCRVGLAPTGKRRLSRRTSKHDQIYHGAADNASGGRPRCSRWRRASKPRRRLPRGPFSSSRRPARSAAGLARATTCNTRYIRCAARSRTSTSTASIRGAAPETSPSSVPESQRWMTCSCGRPRHKGGLSGPTRGPSSALSTVQTRWNLRRLVSQCSSSATALTT
jgi:hypothetical protein